MEKSFEEIFEIGQGTNDQSSNTQSTRTFNSLQERLTLCKGCENKKIDFQDGLKCSLTGEKPNFPTFCPDYKGDIAEKDLKVKKPKGFFGSWKGALVMSLLGFLRAATRGFEGFGLVFMVLGIVWLIIALVGDRD